MGLSLNTNNPVLLLLLLQLPLLELLGGDLLSADLAHDLHLSPGLLGSAGRSELGGKFLHHIKVLPCSLSGRSIAILLVVDSLLVPVGGSVRDLDDIIINVNGLKPTSRGPDKEEN